MKSRLNNVECLLLFPIPKNVQSNSVLKLVGARNVLPHEESSTEIIIRATRTHDVLDEKGRQSRDFTSVVQRRFGFAVNSVKQFA